MRGLTQAEARARAIRGESNATRDTTSRTLGDIVRANVLTRFNALLGSMLVVILVVGPIQDAVFGLIIVLNTLVGVAQEVRAKLTLDRLAILTSPRATVVRDGRAVSVPAVEVVVDDLVQAGPGDEIVVDGSVEEAQALEVNEALLTGESDAVRREPGDELLAGSFVSAGTGVYRATRVGESTYARRLTVEARHFQLVRSQLMRGINQILRLVTWIILPTAILLTASQLRASATVADAARGSVAGVITLVPEGLVLLTSASLALAVIRLGRRKVVVQQLAAVEMLARADVVCFDKTGTLTEPEMAVTGTSPLEAGSPADLALAAVAHVDPRPNASMRAVVRAYPAAPGWVAEQTIPFSSGRKWSAARFRDHGWWVIGAPDVVVPGWTGGGDQRALLLARARAVDAADGIADAEPVAVVSLAETIRPDAATTVRHLLDQGLEVKVISGDHPAVLAAIARSVGLPNLEVVDARSLPTAEDQLVDLVRRVSLFGRVKPEQKRSLVRALRSGGHVVAMCGDGVNDVLALKEADLGIAIGGGSTAARAIAACILADGSFAGLPAVLAEGRRVIGNVERLASLFFTKTVYAFMLAVAVGVAVVPFPFLPRQLTLISAFTIGIPSVFLTLAQSFTPTREPFLRHVMAFALPAGLVAAAATFTAYALAVNEPDLSLVEERTVATVVMAAIGVWILARLAAPLSPRRQVLVAAMALGFMAVLLVPAARAFFDLDFPRAVVGFAALGVIAVALALLEVGDRIVRRATEARHRRV